MADHPAKRTHPSGPPPAGPARWCREACLALPGAGVDWPFGPDADVFRIHGKMFALLTHNPRVSDHMIVNLKAEPDEVPLLIAAHEVIRPGFHMNKRHWITVELSPEADLSLVEELIADSYDNVVAGLPARLRSPLRSLSAALTERCGHGALPD
jgi:predicted DNA-binding protein (MmcQ/YjbR family)